VKEDYKINFVSLVSFCICKGTTWLVDEVTNMAPDVTGTEPPPTKRQRVDVEISDPRIVRGIRRVNAVNPGEEVASYLRQTNIPRSQSPLLWWRDNQLSFPKVARVARRYLSAPSTSVPSERLFSSAGLIYTDRRNRLLPEKAEQLLFVKHNLPLIHFDY
jgi:hypothetical protein